MATQLSNRGGAVSRRLAATPTRRPLVVLLAVTAAATVSLVIELAGGDLRSPAFGSSVSRDVALGHVVVTSAAASLAGWAALASLERITRRAKALWTVLATAVLVASLAGPMSGDGIDAATRSGLIALHLLVGAVLIPLLPAPGHTAGTGEPLDVTPVSRTR